MTKNLEDCLKQIPNVYYDFEKRYYNFFKETYNCTETNYNNDKEKKMKTKEILDLWYEKSMDNILACYAKKKSEIFENDVVNKRIKESINKLNEDLKEYGISITDTLLSTILGLTTKETAEEIRKNEQLCCEAKKKLITTVREIKTMASACETYEQEIKILETYDVIDSKGKLTIIEK